MAASIRSTPPPPRTAALRIRRTAAILVTGLLLGACASSGSNDSKDKEPVPIRAYSPEMLKGSGSSGAVLLDIDTSLKAWHQLLLTAKDETDARTARALEEDLAYKSTKHQALLIEQLESGGITNRRVAAMALGFTRGNVSMTATDLSRSKVRDPLPVLLAALEDPEAKVAANAAFAVGLLAAPKTPTGGLVHMLEFSQATEARTNAAWALKQLVDKGTDPVPLIPAARRGLHTDLPGVRSTCALILAAALDLDAMDDLALQLYDDENLPAVAAAQALGYIGSRDDSAYGSSARALTAALPKVRKHVRERILTVLSQMGERNYGPDNDEAWIEWAHKIP